MSMFSKFRKKKPADTTPDTVLKAKKAAAPASPPKPKPAPVDTSALNQQIVQAVSFSNQENASYSDTMMQTPADLMVGNATGLAVQDAESYMSAVMQIALAAQAVAIKKAAEGPVQAAEEIPLLAEVQKMVKSAVTVYGDVCTTAGEGAKTVITDLNAS